MRKFIQWFFGIAIAAVLLAIAAYLLAKKYEEPVREYIVAQVNKRLQSEVHVSDINFSILERFPSASLVMDDVWAEENLVKIGKPDTLFFFKKVYLNLNLFDVINGQYKINEIEVREGTMKLLVDKDGYDNYHIWKEQSDSSSFLLELDKVHIEDTKFVFENRLRNQRFDLTADDLYFNGRFSSKTYTMAVNGDGVIHDLMLKGTSYVKHRIIHLESDLDINSAEQRYAFRRGIIKVDDVLNFEVSGQFVRDGIDLRIQGDQLDILHTLSLIPIDSRREIDDYESEGELSFNCTLKGAFGRTENPRLEADFSFTDAEISKKGSSVVLSQLTGNGTIDNGAQKNFSTVRLVLENLKGNLNEDPFKAEFILENFLKPSITGDLELKSDLGALNELIGFESVDYASGRIAISAHIEAIIEDLNQPKASEFLNSRASGMVNINNAEVKLKDDERKYVIDTTSLELLNDDLKISKYVGAINSTSIELEGQALGFLGYVFSKDGRLRVTGKVKAGNTNLNELFPTESDAKSGVVAAFPDRTRWDLDLIADGFQIQNFIAKEISGRLVVNPFKVEASRLQFVSQSGNVSGKAGVYQFAENQLGIRTEFTCDQIDIHELFTTFKNFNQTFLPAEVLEGRVDADISFQAFCDSTLSIEQRSIVSTAQVKVTDGELNHFEPLISIADEIRKKPFMRLFISVDELEKRLETVRFATLENEISIRNGIITIPQMTISSSALNINVHGTHGFDNSIDYDIDFAMSEVLQLKNRKEDYNEYVERDDEGNTRVYIKMKGTTDDYNVTMERTDLKKNIKKEIDAERQTVKQIFQQEFIGVDTQETPEKPANLQFEFEAEEKSVEPDKGLSDEPKEKDLKESKPEEKKGLLERVIKKTESDKKKLREGDFEDDDF